MSAYIKEQRSLVPRSRGEHSPSGISGTRGVLEQQRRFEDSQGKSREEVSHRAEMRQM